jgi:hypothetical protein
MGKSMFWMGKSMKNLGKIHEPWEMDGNMEVLGWENPSMEGVEMGDRNTI